MTARALALILLVGAAALYAATVPGARSRAASARAERELLEQERRDLAERLVQLERRQRLRRLAVARASGAADPTALAGVRERVVEALAQLSLSRVQLSVAPGRAPAAVSISLSAAGTQSDVLRLLNRIAHPAGDLVLTGIALRPTGASDVAVAVDGYSLGGAP